MYQGSKTQLTLSQHTSSSSRRKNKANISPLQTPAIHCARECSRSASRERASLPA